MTNGSDDKTRTACPFCGSTRLRRDVVPNTQGNRRHVTCMECHAQGPWSTIAIDEERGWNDRAPISAEGRIDNGWMAQNVNDFASHFLQRYKVQGSLREGLMYAFHRTWHGVRASPATAEEAKNWPEPAWIEEELKDGDRICEEAGVQRTEGGRLPVAKIINKLTASSSVKNAAPQEAEGGAVQETPKAPAVAATSSSVALPVNPDNGRGSATGANACVPSAITPSEPWTPTHRHADGGSYRMVQRAHFKGAADKEWRWAVVYQAEDGNTFVTDDARWAERFTPIRPPDRKDQT